MMQIRGANIMDLRNHFITVNRPYQEGTVEVFQQRIVTGRVQKATLTITALGIYEAVLNGKKVGDALFAPGYTYYPKNLHFQVYDVTDLLTGDDVLTVFLGQGWYCGRFTFHNKVQIYGKQPAAAWILSVEADSGNYCFCADDVNVTAVSSPYEYAGFYDGEVYHGDCFSYEVIQPTKYTRALPDYLEESNMCVRIREEMPVKTVTTHGDVTILDFGQNFAGFIEIDPANMNGRTLKLGHGEILLPDGTLYTDNLRKAKAEIIYHKGETLEKYRPRFTYMGFRYVELSGVNYVPGLLRAYAIHSDMKRTGYFSCENVLVQKLFENQLWGQKSNYVEVPTDCPQRDERMGYTGDGHVFARTGAYNFDTEDFWAKFLKDIRFSQMENEEGYITPTVPSEPKEQRGFMSMLGWGNCITIVPEMLYWQFGTDRFIREFYDSMKAFVDLEIRKAGVFPGRKHLWIGPSLGDWLTHGKSVGYLILHNSPVSNAFFVNDLRIMAWAARYLGKTEDAKRYAALLEKSRDAYIKTFVRSNGKMRDDYQGAYIMALKMVIPNGILWDRVFQMLVKKIHKEGMQTGFFATEHILPLLAENGQQKLAYDLLLQDKCPGWMHQVKQGATTTWERWDALKPDGSVNESQMGSDNMVSFNHYAFGSVGAFYYQNILGIKPETPGFKKIRIQPLPDERLGYVSGDYCSRSGNIHVDWNCTTGIINITTPVDAEITLPNGRAESVSVGSYQFQYI